MTPLEINKTIADIKGYEIFDPYTTANKPYDVNAIYRESGIPYNWAEKIKDAFELFEEMPEAELKHDNCTEENKKWFYCIEKKNNLHVYGDTAPMAICLAWISWKKAQ